MYTNNYKPSRIIYDTYTVPVVDRSTSNEFKDVLAKSECSEKKYSIRVHKACDEVRKRFNKLAYYKEESFKLKLELIKEVALKYEINFVSLRKVIFGEI